MTQRHGRPRIISKHLHAHHRHGELSGAGAAGYLLTPQMMASFAARWRVLLWATVIISLWAIVRAGVGLVLAILRRPVFNPRGLLL